VEGNGDDDGWETVLRTGKTRTRSSGSTIGQKELVKSHAANCGMSTKSQTSLPDGLNLATTTDGTQDEAPASRRISCTSSLPGGMNNTTVAERGTISNGEHSPLTSFEACSSDKETTVLCADSQMAASTADCKKRASADTSAYQSRDLSDHQPPGGIQRDVHSVALPMESNVTSAAADATSG
jgi:hypothetical protein